MMETYLEKSVNPWKKELGIHIVMMKSPNTNNDFRSQQPSWNMAATSFLKAITVKTIKWKTARVKLILMIAEVPKHADKSPEAPGHCKKLGSIFTSFFTVKRSIMETSAHIS